MRARSWFLAAAVAAALGCQGCLELSGARREPATPISVLRSFPQSCRQVWPAAWKSLTEQGFRLMGVQQGVASFQWADERRLARLRATGELDRFVAPPGGVFNGVREPRIESAVLELRDRSDGGCEADLTMTFTARPGTLALKRGWVRINSTGRLEQSLLDAAAAALHPALRPKAQTAKAQVPRMTARVAEVTVAGAQEPAAEALSARASDAESDTRLLRLGIAH